MDWNEKLQRIVDYVEVHLQRKEEPVDIMEISRIAECSYGFFQKVFSYMNGISFAEYIRFRKLTLAGYDLKSTDIKVVDVSYKYGYGSPTSFTKAFQNFHGVSPKEARNKDIELRVFPKMQINARQQYCWRIEKKPCFRLVGKSIRISGKEGNQELKIPEFWSECQKNGIFSELIAMDSGAGKGMFGVFGSYAPESDEMEYAITINSEKIVRGKYTEIIIPEALWAVFDCRGPVPQAIQSGWKYLNEEWMVNYPFKHADCPEIEWYSTGNSFDKNYLSQIWIPIIEE